MFHTWLQELTLVVVAIAISGETWHRIKHFRLRKFTWASSYAAVPRLVRESLSGCIGALGIRGSLMTRTSVVAKVKECVAESIHEYLALPYRNVVGVIVALTPVVGTMRSSGSDCMLFCSSASNVLWKGMRNSARALDKRGRYLTV